MLIITSASYIVEELRSEIGNIPPSFLPIGNQKLFQLQISQMISKYNRIVLTLPLDFKYSTAEKLYFEKYHITIIKTDSSLSLKDALLLTLKEVKIDFYNEQVSILYGDSFFPNLNFFENDTLILSKSDENYNWEIEPLTPKNNLHNQYVWAGFFIFSNGKILYDLLLEDTDNFIDVVRKYDHHIPMQKKIIDAWYDFGHVHTYFESKQKITSERCFNSLTIKDGVVIKTSENSYKMQAEANWFRNLASPIKKFTPNFITTIYENDKICGYSLEYLANFSLSEIYTYGRLPLITWKRILFSCKSFLEIIYFIEPQQPISLDELEIIYLKKTLARLEEYFSQNSNINFTQTWVLNGIPLPSLNQVLYNTWERILINKHLSTIGITHGDFCLSNILYNFRSQQIKVIDPRGLDTNNSIGYNYDSRYDIAKLGHSIIGYYDLIISGNYKLEQDNNTIWFHFYETREDLKELFMNLEIRGKKIYDWDIYPLMVMLFLSMLPLHKDSPQRQIAMLANAFRLYIEMEKII